VRGSNGEASSAALGSRTAFNIKPDNMMTAGRKLKQSIVFDFIVQNRVLLPRHSTVFRLHEQHTASEGISWEQYQLFVSANSIAIGSAHLGRTE
jgi:hypothetical protein